MEPKDCKNCMRAGSVCLSWARPELLFSVSHRKGEGAMLMVRVKSSVTYWATVMPLSNLCSL